MNKYELLYKHSNPNIVYDNAKNLYTFFNLDMSTRQDKKYMIRSPETDYKWVHFGSIDYEDYTKHHDRDRRDNFRRRNARWKNANINTPAYLSYHLLW